MIKRILAGLLAILLLMTCVSCGKQEESDPLANLPIQNQEENREETPDPQEPPSEVPDREEEKTEEEQQPAEDPKEEQKQEEKPEENKPEEESEENPEETPEKNPEEEQEPEEKPEENKPEEEQKPDSPYTGTAVSVKTGTAKLLKSGEYQDIPDLKIMTNSDNLYRITTMDAMERFDLQISDWFVRESEEEDEDEEETLQFSLQDEIGTSYDAAFFSKSALLVLPVSGTVGTVEAVTTEGTTLNIWIKKVASGTGVLGEIATNFVVMELEKATVTAAKTFKLNYLS